MEVVRTVGKYRWKAEVVRRREGRYTGKKESKKEKGEVDRMESKGIKEGEHVDRRKGGRK